MSTPHRRIVITGMGLVCPLGNSAEELWTALAAGHSGISPLTRVAPDHLATDVAGSADRFSGAIEDFGPLDKQMQRGIKKALKLMCREIQMGVAAAQLAIHDAGWSPGVYPPERIGTMFGSDYIITEPGEFSAGVTRCTADGAFDFSRWGAEGLTQVEPLWLLKYLPNMPASHVAIFNDFRGPSNSITLREASSNLSVAEAVTTIRRGAADAALVGSTGSRIHPLRTLHCSMQEQLATRGLEPSAASRPFDAARTGMVIGEGAGVVTLEELESARARGATIHGEVIGYGSSTVASRNGVADFRQAFRNVIRMSLETSGLNAADIGHVHAHGLATIRCDEEEALAIRELLGDVPVVAAKANMGNLGAGSGMVELIASLRALRAGHVFPQINCEQPDPQCPVRIDATGSTPAGTCFLNLNISPQGQASSVLVRAIG